MADGEDRGTGASGLARISDYLFGRNTLLGLAEVMLLIIAGYATWHGMRDFIVGVSQTPAQPSGGMSVSNDVLVAAVCIALTFLMWLALRETFGAQRRWSERLITAPLYIFLALWSIGFGYGFWWSLIAGQEATRTGLAALQEDARDAGNAIAARLDAVRSQLDNVASWSDSQMAREEASGGSCGVASGAGRGPLYNARRSVRDSVATLRDGMTKSWLEPVRLEVAQLEQAAGATEGVTVEERQRRFEAKAAEIRGRARAIAGRSNELGKSTAAEMRALAETVGVAPGQPGFACYDATLAQRLKQAAEQADQPAVLTLRAAEFNEGPAGVANAIKKLWSNIGSYLSSLVAYVFTGGSSTGGNTAGGDPISGRDMIALLATIGIDLGLLAMAALNPPSAGPVRRDGLAAAQAELHLPTASAIRHLTAAIETAISRAPGADLEWVRQHFIHHDGASYFVIPNLYSVDQASREEELRALAVNQLAGVFDDLKLVRAMGEKELKHFGLQESRHSYSDLTPYRDDRDQAREQPAAGGWFSTKPADAPVIDSRKRMRNHGLLSKAQRALDIAKWSKAAQSDVEIYRLVDTEGLTPLLTLLNEATLQKGAEAAEAARTEQRQVRDGGIIGSATPPLIGYQQRET